MNNLKLPYSNVNEDYYYIFEHWFDGEMLAANIGIKQEGYLIEKDNEVYSGIDEKEFIAFEVVIKAYFKNLEDAMEFFSLKYGSLKLRKINNENLKSLKSLKNTAYKKLNENWFYGQSTMTKKK